MTASLIAITAVALIATALFFYRENNDVTITRIEEPSDRVENRIRIALISDLHGKSFGRGNAVLSGLIRAERPDLVCFSGDLTDGRDRKGLKDRVGTDLLVDLAGSFPVFYIPGNHEKDGGDRIAWVNETLSRGGVRLMSFRTESITVGKSRVTVGGTEELLPGASPSSLLERLKGGEGLRVLLCHYPDMFEKYAGGGADLMLSGHAHGGQIILPIIGGLYAPGQGPLPKYYTGVHRLRGTTMVVSRGLGASIFPTRLMNRPEIVIIDVEPKGKEKEREDAANRNER